MTFNHHECHTSLYLSRARTLCMAWDLSEICIQWASCQIHKIAGCACAGNAGGRFPLHRLPRKQLVSDPSMHHGTRATHVPWCMPGSPTRRWQGKRSQHTRRMRNPQFHVSGKRPMVSIRPAIICFGQNLDLVISIILTITTVSNESCFPIHNVGLFISDTPINVFRRSFKQVIKHRIPLFYELRKSNQKWFVLPIWR